MNLGLGNRRKDNSRKGAKGAKEEDQILGDVASESALWQLVEMVRESRLDEGAQREKRVLGSNVIYIQLPGL